MTDTVQLSDPLTLRCGVTLKNRFGKSAMSERLGDRRGVATESLVRLYDRWSKGGIGLLITGNVMVDRSALGEPNNVVTEDERGLEMLRRWAAAGTQNGTQLWMQINHPGRQSPRMLSPHPVAPSAIPVRLGGVFAKPRALTEAEIENLIEHYGETARIAKKAGFSGVQIHGAHGYLVSQFLSPLANVRTDRWGGSPENRRRFVVEVFRSMRRAVGDSFPVSIKLNSADFQRGGFTEEESLDVVRALDAEGLDLLEISGGTYERPAMFFPKGTTAEREAYFIAFAEKVRQCTKLPVMVTGGFRTLAGMRAALATGAVDVIGMARPLAVYPEAPGQLLRGEIESVRYELPSAGAAASKGLSEIGWHTLQLHRMGAGKDPDLNLGGWHALLSTLVSQGWNAFRTVR